MEMTIFSRIQMTYIPFFKLMCRALYTSRDYAHRSSQTLLCVIIKRNIHDLVTFVLLYLYFKKYHFFPTR